LGAQIFKIIGALVCVVTEQVNALRTPTLCASAPLFAELFEHRFAQVGFVERQLQPFAANQIGFGQSCAALIERDHVTNLAHGLKERKARAARCRNARTAGATRQINNRRARIGRGAFEAHEG
jgi:hypothetical protein